MELLETGFLSIAERINFSVDHVRYIVLLFLTYPIALVFRYLLHPSLFSTLTRHLVAMSFGLAFGFICFGAQEMFYLFVMVGVSYALLWLAPSSIVQRYTMGWAMACMSAAHIYRLITDPGGYHLDFTGPLMLLVQRVTLIGFALHDGLSRRESELNKDQKEQKIDVRPSPLEYMSYTFSVFSFLAGPTCTIREYLNFIDGSNLRPLDNPNQYANGKKLAKEPSAFHPVVSKLFISLASLAVYLTCYLPDNASLDPSRSILYLILVSWVVAVKLRCRFYFIWLLTESSCNLAGLGFSGHDELGNPKWDIMTNTNIMAVEIPPNFRSVCMNWNKLTAEWLRRVCYERVTFSPNLTTWVVSACWHGFYPGYYLAFICCAFYIEAARKLRRLLRPHFLGSPVLKLLYDVSTTVLTMFSTAFAVWPFIFLWLENGLLYWSQFYYMPLVVAVALAVLLPSGKRSTHSKTDSDKALSRHQAPHRDHTHKTDKVD